MDSLMRFGILGTGNIATQFAEGVLGSYRSTISAVASRSEKSAGVFGQRFDLPPEKCFGNYQDLLRDDELDAVYISLPNHLHAEWTIKALHAGKHVLCEKPFAMNAAETERVLTEAELSGKRVMEAFMYRCHPLMNEVHKAVRGGAIGQLRMIRANFCYFTKRVDGNVRFDPTIGGGALMDIGSYCVNFARFFAGGEPVASHVVGHRHDTGVDDYAAGVLKFPGHLDTPFANDPITAAITFGMTAQLDNTAYLGGTDGYLEIPIPWKPPQRDAVYVLHGQTPPKQDLVDGAAGRPEPQRFTVDAPAPLFGTEADAFADAIQVGNPFPVTAEDTLGNMRLLDTLRSQLGLPW